MLERIRARVNELLDQADHIFSCVQILDDNTYLLARCKGLELENRELRCRLGLEPDEKILGLHHRRN
jgi:hypothetical protein